MPSYLSLSPVSEAVYGLLNVAGLLALAPGGVHDHLPQDTTFPCVLFTVEEDRLGGLGTKPGTTSMLQVNLRLHVFTQDAGMQTAQAILAKAIELLNVTHTVSGYTFCGTEPFFDEAVPVGDELIAGVRVKELAGNWRLYVQEA